MWWTGVEITAVSANDAVSFWSNVSSSKQPARKKGDPFGCYSSFFEITEVGIVGISV